MDPSHFDSDAPAPDEFVPGQDIVTESPIEDAVPVQRRRRKPAGPGLPESLLWIFLFFVFQLGGLLVVMIALLAMHPEVLRQEHGFDFADWMQNLDPISKMNLIGMPVFLCFVLLIPLGLWRMTPAPLRKLKMELPTVGQTLIVLSLLVPVIVVSDFLFRTVKQLLSGTGLLEPLEQMFVQNQLMELKDSPLWMMVFFIAVMPAIGEEFLFRGLIGRGLTARWGLVTGVVITSLLFGIVHVYPPHVAAAAMMGVALHVIYLTTKSYWAPVMFHFINNTLSVVMMRVQQEQVGDPSLLISFGCLIYVFWCLYWLYQMRTEYRPFVHKESVGELPPTGENSSVEQSEPRPEFRRVAATYAFPCIVAAVVLALGFVDVLTDLFPSLQDLFS